MRKDRDADAMDVNAEDERAESAVKIMMRNATVLCGKGVIRYRKRHKEVSKDILV